MLIKISVGNSLLPELDLRALFTSFVLVFDLIVVLKAILWSGSFEI